MWFCKIMFCNIYALVWVIHIFRFHLVFERNYFFFYLKEDKRDFSKSTSEFSLFPIKSLRKILTSGLDQKLW